MKLDYEVAEGHWGRRAFWLLVGVALPLAWWLMNRGEEEEPASEPPQPAPAPAPSAPQAAEPVVETPVEVVDTVETVETVEPPATPESTSAESRVEEVAAVAAASATESAAAGSAPPSEGRFPMKARLVDSKDVAHDIWVMSLDTKSVHIGPEPALAEKEKVSLQLSDGGETLSLAAHLASPGPAGENQVLTLFPLRAGLKKRLQAFIKA